MNEADNSRVGVPGRKDRPRTVWPFRGPGDR